MYTNDDLIDAILEALRGAPAGLKAGSPPAKPRLAQEAPLKGRPFLTERDVRRSVTDGILTVPRDAIISPLAQEWLALGGIRVVRR